MSQNIVIYPSDRSFWQSILLWLANQESNPVGKQNIFKNYCPRKAPYRSVVSTPENVRKSNLDFNSDCSNDLNVRILMFLMRLAEKSASLLA